MSKQEERITEVHRLSPEAMRQLEKVVPLPGSPRDGIQAAYNLGIQYVLKVLREGFVHG